MFPVGDRLCIVAEVTELSSGNKQKNSDSSTWFTDVPVRLDCDLSPPFYRPHLPLRVTVLPVLSYFMQYRGLYFYLLVATGKGNVS